MLYSTVWDFQAKVIVIAALVIYEMVFLLHLCCVWLFLFVVSDSSYSADVLNYVYRVVWYLCYCFLYYLCLVALLFIVCTLLVKQFSGWVLLEGVIIWLFFVTLRLCSLSAPWCGTVMYVKCCSCSICFVLHRVMLVSFQLLAGNLTLITCWSCSVLCCMQVATLSLGSCTKHVASHHHLSHLHL